MSDSLNPRARAFLRSAQDAVTQWHYRPTILNGQPVEVITYFTVTFHLGQ